MNSPNTKEKTAYWNNSAMII